VTCFAGSGGGIVTRAQKIVVAVASITAIPTATWPANAQSKRTDGLAAWQRVYSVLTHPRCINCHTATGYPQQGDDRHRHGFNVVRGQTGMGVPAFTCAACHQRVNADSTGVPGAPGWHLAPLSMQWQDTRDQTMSSGAVCKAVTDRSKNHNLDGASLLKHHEEEPLVLWAFQPGRGLDGSPRSVPPLTHAEFVAATRTWVEAGVPCPTR
jgi:mono/diheme cytochrome c family protein